MKPKQILRLCLLVAAMAVLSLFQGAPAVRADDLNPSYSVALWDTKYFQGDGGEWCRSCVDMVKHSVIV